MANKNIFGSADVAVPTADTVNEAGGKAYQMSEKASLAQYAVTGTFNNTFYASAKTQLDKTLEMTRKVDSVFLAKLAVYARKDGYMKDMPAFLLAVLAGRSDAQSCLCFEKAFPLVIDNGKMLRNFVQIMRSGAIGRRSLGSKAKRLIKKWFNRDANRIFKDSIGNNPSLGDVLKLSHPHPASKQHEALFAYLVGKKAKSKNLPDIVKQYEAFKADPYNSEVPNVPFQFLASLDIPERVWKDIARNGGWHMVRMNLNTFNRHGVFNDSEMVKMVADKLCDEDQIRKSRVFPYQLLAAYLNADCRIPMKITNALQDAMEIATQNVPRFGENVFVLPDVSGSMHSSVTGFRNGATSKVSCIDVAALVASSILRTTPEAEVMPFSTSVCKCRLNPRDSVMTNAKKLARLGGGGTNCGAPLEKIFDSGSKVDLVIYVSDNQSWIDSNNSWGYRVGTSVATTWSKIKRKNRNAKMVCIDIQPYDTVQVPDDKSVMNIGGFSDQIFTTIDNFVQGSNEHWVKVIEKVEI